MCTIVHTLYISYIALNNACIHKHAITIIVCQYYKHLVIKCESTHSKIIEVSLELNLLGEEEEKKQQLRDFNPGCLTVAVKTTEPKKPPQQPAIPILLSCCTGGTAKLQSHTGETTQLCGFKRGDIRTTNCVNYLHFYD